MPLKESTGQRGSFILFRIKMSIFSEEQYFVIERLVALKLLLWWYSISCVEVEIRGQTKGDLQQQ